MHSRYGVLDGELVVADLGVVDGKLSQVVVSGDFFLEPDESFDDIIQALTGLSHTFSVADLTAAINFCLPKDARLFGFFLEAVGIVVRRALGHTTNWDDHISDVIDPATLDLRLHVALNEVLVARTARGEIGPSLRIWDWDQLLVVIGFFQNCRSEIDEEGRERHGISVVRRITSDGTMFMEPDSCAIHLLLVPGSLVEGLSFERNYEFLSQWVVGAPAKLGVTVRYVPLNGIASDKGKTAGAAQHRLTSDMVLHHVTTAHDIDADKMPQALQIGREKLPDKGTKLANKRVDPLCSQTQLPRDQIVDSSLEYLKSRYPTRRRNHTDSELVAAAGLMREKFVTSK